MSSITHTSLDAFEQRARTGKVTTKVDADLQMVVALIAVARELRAVLGESFPAVLAVDPPIRPEQFRRLHAALASVPA